MSRKVVGHRRTLKPRLVLAACVGLAACLTMTVAAASAARNASSKTLTWGLASSIPTLFGPNAFSTEAATVASLVNEGMLKFGTTGELQPALASSWKAVSPTKYVYTIRRGVKFSDGHALTAQDVAYSLALGKDPKVASEMSTFFTNVKSIHGAGNQVTVVLSKPDSIWKYMPAHEAGYIYESASVRAHLNGYGTPNAFPIGTGPYKVSSYSSTQITLVRNPYYWGKKPLYDKIVFNVIPNPQTLYLALRSGQIDGTFDVPGAQLAQWISTSGISMASFTADGFHGLTLDQTQAPFSDVHVRRAIAYAIDKRGIINAVFGGKAQVATTLDQPSMFTGILPAKQVASLYSKIAAYPFSVAKAKAELAQSSVPNGFSMTLNVPQDSPNSVAISQIVQASLAKIGITVNFNMMPGGPRFQVILDHGPNLGMQIIGNVVDVPDPIEMPWLYYKSDQAVKGGNNSSNYRKASVDALVTTAQTTTNQQLAALDAIKAETQAATDVAFIPFEWFTWHCATKSTITTHGLGPFYYNTVWVNNLAAS